eukprot:9476221-Ditylum_brightwellii.AAC.1
MVILGILPNVTSPFNGVSLTYVDNVYCFKSVYNKSSDNASMPPLALFNTPALAPVSSTTPTPPHVPGLSFEERAVASSESHME